MTHFTSDSIFEMIVLIYGQSIAIFIGSFTENNHSQFWNELKTGANLNPSTHHHHLMWTNFIYIYAEISHICPV